MIWKIGFFLCIIFFTLKQQSAKQIVCTLKYIMIKRYINQFELKYNVPNDMLVLQGRGVFLLDQQNNPDRLHTNPNCNIVKDSKSNTYYINVL